MAEVILKNVRKVYPNTENKKKKKKDEAVEKKNNLEITDEGVVAVQDFNIDVADKEFIVLVGPSGCGKSTTLRMIAGLEEISGGELFIDGKQMNDVAPKDRDIAMVFQNYALFPNMTLAQNIAVGVRDRAKRKETVARLVKAFYLEGSEGKHPRQLSGGQQQRTALARILASEPEVLLLDEPFTGLDRENRDLALACIRETAGDRPVLLVTHDAADAAGSPVVTL